MINFLLPLLFLIATPSNGEPQEPYYKDTIFVGTQDLDCVLSTPSPRNRRDVPGYAGGGAAAGAALGTAMFPGIGTIIGAGIGALLGSKVYHELVFFKGYYYEFGTDGLWVGTSPRSKQCDINWYREGLSYAYQSDTLIYSDAYDRKYEYDLLVRNCQDFVNEFVDFLKNNKYVVYPVFKGLADTYRIFSYKGHVFQWRNEETPCTRKPYNTHTDQNLHFDLEPVAYNRETYTTDSIYYYNMTTYCDRYIEKYGPYVRSYHTSRLAYTRFNPLFINNNNYRQTDVWYEYAIARKRKIIPVSTKHADDECLDTCRQSCLNKSLILTEQNTEQYTKQPTQEALTEQPTQEALIEQPTQQALYQRICTTACAKKCYRTIITLVRASKAQKKIQKRYLSPLRRTRKYGLVVLFRNRYSMLNEKTGIATLLPKYDETLFNFTFNGLIHKIRFSNHVSTQSSKCTLDDINNFGLTYSYFIPRKYYDSDYIQSLKTYLTTDCTPWIFRCYRPRYNRCTEVKSLAFEHTYRYHKGSRGIFFNTCTDYRKHFTAFCAA